MEQLTIIAYMAGAIGVLATLTAAFVVFRSTRSKTTNQINEDNIKALQLQDTLKTEKINGLIDSNSGLSKQVTILSGKVDTLSKIPLQKIEQHMADTNRILQSVIPFIGQPSTTHTTTEIIKTTGQQ